MMTTSEVLPSSFRDPAGFLFKRDNILYRQVNQSYAADFEAAQEAGLFQALLKAKLLIPHEEVDIEPAIQESHYKTLQPELVSFISHPYEWSFSQLKDAALATITIQRLAMKHGMCLKDASAYNIQFHEGRAVLIDTLSFIKYEEGKPWQGYKQYCQHFLAPLALMGATDVRLSQLLRVYIDGIPLDIASKLLPFKSYLSPFLLTHLHAHAKAQIQYAETTDEPNEKANKATKSISHRAMDAMLQSLHAGTRKLNWKAPKTEWGDYYSATNYADQALQHKEFLVRLFLTEIKAASGDAQVHDLGANNGHFSRVACDLGFNAIAWDIDPVAVESNYKQNKKDKLPNLLPLVLDLTNPSGAIGWASNERESFAQRAQNNIVLSLALIHHLAISNNVPLSLIAEFLHRLAHHLVIEFIPKSDSQVKRLLSNRTDIFSEYHQQGFENAFKQKFDIVKKEQIKDSERLLYLMRRK
jgi:hypothetical protein